MMVDKMDKLKPCPFCGGEAVYANIPIPKKILFRKPDQMVYVRCNTCHATSMVKYTVDEARAAWNRMASDG